MQDKHTREKLADLYEMASDDLRAAAVRVLKEGNANVILTCALSHLTEATEIIERKIALRAQAVTA